MQVLILDYLCAPSGHRVATQYLLAALEGALPVEHLLRYREANSKLPGHPELGLTPGIKFSSGRLGHIWLVIISDVLLVYNRSRRSLVNGIALANRDKTVFCLGSDGSQQEGNDAEAARIAVAQNLNVKLLIDANDVTIAGHPSEYLKGFDIEKTLKGHGLKVVRVDGEDIDALWDGVCQVVNYDGPAAGTHDVTLLLLSIDVTVFSCQHTRHGAWHSFNRGENSSA
jgi:transketolase N-terminal domain/subunit